MTDPTAVMGRRILAYFIDGLIGLIVLLALLIPLARSKAETRTFANNAEASAFCNDINDNTFGTDGSSGTFESNRSTGGQLFPSDSTFCIPVGTTNYIYTGADANSLFGQFQLFSILSTALNVLVLQGLTGASIGKYMTGIRVVRENGDRVGFGWNLLRWLLLFVDSFCFALVGLITAFSSKGHRRVGDMAASTFVVRKSAMGSPIQVPGMTTPVPGNAWPQAYPDQAQAQAGWTAPPTAGTWAPTQTATQAPGADGPTWDNARNTYIQYDREVGAWVQWDDNAKSWRPIDQ